MVVSWIMANPIGDRVRHLREAQGLSQKELAVGARVPRTWLNNLENGQSMQPRADRLLRLARALSEDIEYLIAGERRDRGMDVPMNVTPEEADLLRTVRQFAHISVDRVKRHLVAIYRADDELFYDFSGVKDDARDAARRQAADDSGPAYQP